MTDARIFCLGSLLAERLRVDPVHRSNTCCFYAIRWKDIEYLLCAPNTCGSRSRDQITRGRELARSATITRLRSCNLEVSNMAKREGYLPVSSSEDGVDAMEPVNRSQSRLRKIAKGSIVALSVLGALSTGYTLGSRNATEVPTTIREYQHVCQPNTLLKECSPSWRCSLLHAVRQNISPKT